MKFEVLRQHQGDRKDLYMPGDTRDATEADVAHLVQSGVLRKAKETKTEPKAANKAEPAAKNKAK